MTFLLDTDTCVFWLRGYETVRKHLIAAKLENIAVSLITVAELRYGAVCSTHPEQNHRAIDDFIGGVTVFGVNAETARSFGDIKANLRQRGMLIEDFDLIIAATACTHNFTLVTNNLAHFLRISGLHLENWGQPSAAISSARE